MLPNRFKYPHRQRPHSAEGDQASSPIEKCGKFYGKSKNFVRQLDHLQQNGYEKQQEFKPTGLSDETVRHFLHSQGYRYCHTQEGTSYTGGLKYQNEPTQKNFGSIEFHFTLMQLVSSTSIILLTRQSQSKQWLGHVMKVLKVIVLPKEAMWVLVEKCCTSWEPYLTHKE